MKTSIDGLKTLELREGLRTTAYQDSVGVWTIGYGHTAGAGDPKPVKGMTITTQAANDLFAKDIIKFENDVNMVFPNGLPQNAFDGAVSFHYNTGAIKSASWPVLYKLGELTEAKQHFLLWNKPPEIITRRESEAKQIFDTPQTLPALPQSTGTQPLPTSTPISQTTQPWYISLLKFIFLGHT